MLTVVQGLEYMLHSLKLAHTGQNCQQAVVTHGSCKLLLCVIKHTTELGMATKQKLPYKEGIPMEKRHMAITLHFSH